MWEQIKDGLDKFTNNPTVIAIGTVLALLVSALVVLSKTSVGKKALNWFKAKYEELVEWIKDAKKVADESLKEVEDAKKELKEAYNQAEKELSGKVTACFSTFELFEVDLFKVLEQIPNAKVQEQLKVWRESYDQKKLEAQSLLGDTYGVIQERINKEVAARTEQSKQEIANLKGEIAELKDLFEKYAKVPELGELEAQNGETEEQDTDSREEVL